MHYPKQLRLNLT